MPLHGLFSGIGQRHLQVQAIHRATATSGGEETIALQFLPFQLNLVRVLQCSHAERCCFLGSTSSTQRKGDTKKYFRISVNKM